MEAKPTVQFGIDHLLHSHLDDLKELRVGLVTNGAAATAAMPQPLLPTRRALQEAGVNLVALFSPEHGLGADAADGARIGDATDSLTGLPVYSLYGATYRPTPAMLTGVDVMLFDIPDIGARFYTYIWTLSHVLEACAVFNMPLWILDRPNPLGGRLEFVEGPLLDEDQFRTFVGRWSMPIRHSLTVGELAALWNGERKLGAEVIVAPVQGWRRSQHWPATGLPFVPPSPAMPDYEAALLYPGACLLEGTNLSEGRGTSTPFRVAGAPWLDAYRLADSFNALDLPGVRARPAQFTPSTSKFSGQLCYGVMLHVTDAQATRPVAMGLHLLAQIIALHPREFKWLPYPTAVNQAGYGHFDRLIGQEDIRDALSKGAGQQPEQIEAWTSAEGWKERVQAYLLYEE
jgi:uncharacterized protein YbbC (DUF1343 family)